MAQWRAIAPLRRERRRWVGVNWHADAGEYRATPRFRAPAGTIASGATPAELAASMDKIEQASPPGHRRGTVARAGAAS